MFCSSINLSARNMDRARSRGASTATAPRRTPCLAQPARRPLVVQAAASNSSQERYALAASKYDAGPLSQAQKLYVRPAVLNLDLDEFDAAQAMAQYTALAAANPLLHSLKQQEERSRQQQPGRSVSWSEIL